MAYLHSGIHGALERGGAQRSRPVSSLPSAAGGADVRQEGFQPIPVGASPPYATGALVLPRGAALLRHSRQRWRSTTRHVARKERRSLRKTSGKSLELLACLIPWATYDYVPKYKDVFDNIFKAQETCIQGHNFT